jgi:DnaJ-domain-containing protein 1
MSVERTIVQMPKYKFSRTFSPKIKTPDRKWIQVETQLIEFEVNFSTDSEVNSNALFLELDSAFEALCKVADRWFQKGVDVLSTKMHNLKAKQAIGSSNKLVDISFKFKFAALVTKFNDDMALAFDNWVKAVMRKFDMVKKDFTNRYNAQAVVVAKRAGNVAYNGASIVGSFVTLSPTAPLTIISSIAAIYSQFSSHLNSIDNKKKLVADELTKLLTLCEGLDKGEKWAKWKLRGVHFETCTGSLTAALTVLGNDIDLLKASEKKLGEQVKKLENDKTAGQLEIRKAMMKLVEVNNVVETATGQMRDTKWIKKEVTQQYNLLSLKEKFSEGTGKKLGKVVKSAKDEVTLLDRPLKRLANVTEITQIIKGVEEELKTRKKTVIFDI